MYMYVTMYMMLLSENPFLHKIAILFRIKPLQYTVLSQKKCTVTLSLQLKVIKRNEYACVSTVVALTLQVH